VSIELSAPVARKYARIGTSAFIWDQALVKIGDARFGREARLRVACRPDGVARSVRAAAVVSARWPGRGVDGPLPPARGDAVGRRGHRRPHGSPVRPAAQGPALSQGTALWLSLWLIHSRSRRFTGDRRPAVRAGQERWRTVVRSTRKREGTSLPWVQIPRPPPPPPPPLACYDGAPSTAAGAPSDQEVIVQRL
jgi:hypothetical protein